MSGTNSECLTDPHRVPGEPRREWPRLAGAYSSITRSGAAIVSPRLVPSRSPHRRRVGAEKVIWVNGEDPNQAGNQYTAAISDAGTESYVCVQPYSLSGEAQGVKACTLYY
jgi:hypothetical protein